MEKIQEIEIKIEGNQILSKEEIEYYISQAQNDSKKLYVIGNLYYKGVCVEKDYQKAIYYYERAGQLGNKVALNNLGEIYENGLGVDVDLLKAICYYEKAIKLGDADALNNIGYLYLCHLYSKENATKQDYQGVIATFEKAGKLGNANALNNLGNMHNFGIGVERDYQKAIDYYEKAGKLGNADALNSLGYLYYKGNGTKINRSKALKLFEQSKQDNLESSRIVYTHKYIEGEQIDFAELFRFYEKEHEGDLYFKKIKRRIDSGYKVVSVESIMDLALEQKNKEVRNIDDIMNSMLTSLSEFDKDAIINVKAGKNIFSTSCSEFYTVFEFKKILKVIHKFFKNIDLNQNEEDRFMQLYIKLGMMLHYDDEAIGRYEKLRTSTARNLMILLKRKGVCMGYATALKILCDVAGIKCVILGSRRDDENRGHAFNQIMINGVWYYVDLTWDSSKLKEKQQLSNCLKSKKSFTEDIHHQTIDLDEQHETNEDYQNVQELIDRNIKKIRDNQTTYENVEIMIPEIGGRVR